LNGPYFVGINPLTGVIYRAGNIVPYGDED